ncbi:MAG: murein biosynthesis integral membrane protein MurJ [Limnochordaceae bacterium]|nr:murein biosynthesis integral membrane protein MurJ [Limnochordaceae bacterium]
MSAREGLFKAAGIVAAVSILSKILGFAREASMAAVFGATHATDAYLMGQTIPTLIFASMGAALGTTFIPVFSQVQQERGREAAFRMANSVVNAAVLLAVIFIAVGELLAGPLARIVAPGFHGPVYELTVEMSRIMFPMVLFQVLSGLMAGMLQTHGNFTVPAVVGLAYNVIIISAILGLGPVFGVKAVGMATVLSIAVQVVLQVPALWRLGYRWRPVLDLRDPGLRRIGTLVGPVLVATAVGQAGTLVDRMLASGLEAGSVAALNYANRLMGLVPGIIGTAVVTVMYPTLAKLAAEKDWARFGRAFAESVKMINFILIPVAVGLAVLSVPLVRLVFERGAFDARATQATAWALLFFCLGVATFTLRDMISRAFFAFQDTKAPMIIGMAGVGINIVLNLLLVGPLQQGGLALATSLAGLFGVVALLWILKVRMRAVSSNPGCTRSASAEGPVGSADGVSPVGIGGKAILSSLWRVMVASGLMGVVVWLAYGWLQGRVPGDGVVAQAMRLFGAVGAGIVSYAGLVWVLGVPEARTALEVIVKGWHKGWARARGLARAWGRV